MSGKYFRSIETCARPELLLDTQHFIPLGHAFAAAE